MERLIDLRSIGPRCQDLLQQVGINTPKQLRELGAMEAYLRIIEETDFKPYIGLLYALVSAIENRDWYDVAQTDKARLKAELEGIQELKN